MSAVIVPPPSTGSSAYIANRTRTNLGLFSAQMNAVRNNTDNAIITIFGDSKTVGTGGVTQSNSPAAQLAYILGVRYGVPATDTLVGFTSGTAATIIAWDSRWSSISGTTAQWNNVGAGKALSLQSNGATATFKPGYAHDVLDFHWPAYPTAAQGGGNLTVALTDGGTFSWVTYLSGSSTPVTSGSSVTSAVIAQNGTNGVLYHTVITRAATSASTAGVTFTNGATNGTQIGFVECWKTGQNRLFVRSSGSVGYTSTLLNTAAVLQYFGQEKSHLVVQMIGANDWTTGVATATTTSNMTAILSSIAYFSPSIINVTPSPSSTGTYSLASQQATVAALKAAFGAGQITLDQWQRWTDQGQYNASSGLYQDTIHESAMGIFDMANLFADVATMAGQ